MVEIVRVDVPVPPAGKVTGFMLNEKVRPVTGAVVEATRLTLPAKLFRLVSVMVEVAELPAARLAGVAALAEMPKSGATTVTATVAEWESDPLVPVAVTVYVPAALLVVGEKVRGKEPVPPAARVTMVVAGLKGRPAGEETLFTVTVPAKPFRLARLIVDVAEDPWTTETEAGVAAILKSGAAGDWTMKLPNIEFGWMAQ